MNNFQLKFFVFGVNRFFRGTGITFRRSGGFFLPNQVYELKTNKFGREFCLVVLFSQPDPHYRYQKKIV